MNRKKPKLSYTSVKSSSAKHNSLGLLGSYKDTSSEESEEETAQKDKRSVISLVEDFVKEVNGMDTKPKSSKKSAAKKSETTSQQQMAAAAPSIAEEPNWGPWKKCIDENTKHPYYWNTQTNQVTWSLPVELQQITSTNPLDNQKEALIETESSEPISKKQKLSKVSSSKESRLSTDVVVGGRSVFAPASRKIDDENDKLSTPSSSSLAAAADKKYQQQKKDESLLLSKPKSKWRTTDESSSHQRSSDRKKSREKIVENSTKIISTSLHDEIMNNQKSCKSSQQHTSNSESCRIPTELHTQLPSDSTQSHTSSDNKLKETIKSTSKILLEKLQYLEMNILSQYNILSIEVKTRAEDWKAGELSDEYVNKKLQQAEDKLKEYERTAVPQGWACDWNSHYSRYYYRNQLTGDTQWNYPQEVAAPSTTASTTASVASNNVVDSTEELQATNNNNNETGTTSTPVTETNNTTTTTATTTNETPSTTTYNQYQQQYWQMYTYPTYNNGSGYTSDTIPPPPGEEQPPLPPPLDTPPLPPPPPTLPPLPSCDVPPLPSCNNDDEMEICSDTETSTVLSDAGSDTSTLSTKKVPPVTAEIVSGPVDYSSVPVRFPVTFPSAAASQASVPTTTTTLLQPQLSNDSDGNNKPIKKIKKMKKLTKKPPKQVSGMISKWQKAQNEIDEEKKKFIREAEEELEEELDVNKRIEKWKKKQLETGKAVGNSNFEPVGDLWKQRVKKRM